jgi:hypothetical protein
MSIEDISEPMFQGRNTYTELELNVPLEASAVNTVDKPTVCPAADPFMDQASYPSCVCRVDGSFVRQKTSPNTYQKWCSKDYQECPAWRLKRDRELQAKS